MSENVFEIRDLKDYTILIPNMAPNQFTLIQAALLSEGYHVELMSKASSQVAQLGLQYVHNDTFRFFHDGAERAFAIETLCL